MNAASFLSSMHTDAKLWLRRGVYPVTIMPKACIPRVAFYSALTLASVAVHADTSLILAIKTESVEKGASVPNTPTPGTYTIQYHEGLARSEGPDGLIRIYDFEHDKVTTLNPLIKTFSIQSRKEFLSDPSRAKLDTHTTLEFKEQTGGDAVFVGINSVLFHLKATLTIEVPNAPARGPSRRRGVGGVGFPGSGFQIPGLPSTTSEPEGPRVYEGDTWIAPESALKLGPKADALPILACMFRPGNVLAALADTFRRRHSEPLMLSAVMPAVHDEPAFRVTAEVQSMDNSGLTDGAFAIPAGYTKTDPPKG